jgi:hypothetical protein
MAAYYDNDDIGDGPNTIRMLALGAAATAALCVAFIVGYTVHDGHAANTKADNTAPGTSARTAPPAGTSSATAGPPATASPRGPLSRNSAGVIVGYSHDKQGAVAATGNYTAAMYVQSNRTHTRELTVLSGIAATPDDATRMAGDFSSEDTALAKLLDVASLQSPGVIAYGHPLGYRVESVSSSAATVDVYVAGGQGVAGSPGDSGSAGETFYEVDQVQLVWQSNGGHGDWRLSSWSHLVQDNGPQLATVAARGYLPFPIGQTNEASRP